MKIFKTSNKPIKAWIDGVELEDEAKKQLFNVASMPFIHKHIAVMPDVHAGMGATIGSVIATKGAIIPAAVGVDIGCGMNALKISLNASHLPDNLFTIRSAIEAAIPHGRTDNGGANDKGSHKEINPKVWHEDESVMGRIIPAFNNKLNEIIEKHPSLKKSANRVFNQLATLGTGNHFIELCLDENKNVWIMLHSGSRGIGNKIGSYFIELAKKDMRKYFINLPDKDLAYLSEGAEYFEDYIEALRLAQIFAKLNRDFMMHRIMVVLQTFFDFPLYSESQAINCHHNYVARENHFGSNVFITRKGALRAREGDLGIIPGSMGAKSFIVRGKGNLESFQSCSHGAGRKMSRTKAKAIFSIDDHIKATEGVECRKDIDVIDETPAAYKDIDAVMAAQSDLVEIIHTLKQIVCIKG